MRSEFETGLAWQSQQVWLASFDGGSEEATPTPSMMSWPELSHIDPQHCPLLAAIAIEDDKDDGSANSATHHDRDCHV
ncbi:MAG: hypothetical protein K2W93_08710 [Burkholderiaceae bacterium]|uniref:hypothetical protein n=1 Tax=Paucibacter sp. KCTC 42545 TaxID=1768242 RepID=UPI000733B90C|nr:hypothetical protein [Paucibacter sp. KCTC 42545]ALT75996.1 hypothetical protein AT984_00960 [Paucibacter sp. KCTC 42545]MBY0235049.1 hypothetical protein [Burkholderiaceae bacterium]